MSELMQLLYDYALDTGFSARLTNPEYRSLSELTDRLEHRLRGLLPDDSWDTLTKYQDALNQQRDLELEAMFLSAFALARELE